MADFKKFHPFYIIAFRVMCGLACLIAISAQLLRSFKNPVFNSVHFFSYFTIESNIWAAAVFFAGAYLLFRRRQGSRVFNFFRGAAVLYMTTTAVVYGLVLRRVSLENPYLLLWSDNILHVLLPLAVIGDWVAFPPEEQVTLSEAIGWTIFPVLWLLCTVIAGFTAGWYPYPFLNPGTPPHYGTVIMSCFVITTFMALVGVVIRHCYSRRAFSKKTKSLPV